MYSRSEKRKVYKIVFYIIGKMESINYVSLVEKNPIKWVSNESNQRLVERLKGTFNEKQQQLFIASFYCYLKHDPVKDFVINLDDVWEWMGFSKK
jgi:hypothetical protein